MIPLVADSNKQHSQDLADLFAAVVLEGLGTCARERGNPRQAAKLFAESLTIVRAGEDPSLVINCVKSLGAVAAVTGHPGQAARAGLPDTEFAAAWANGRALPVAQAISEALALADEVSMPQAPDPHAHRGPTSPADSGESS